MDNKPSKFWAYMAVIVGILLVLMGITALVGYLGLPVLLPIEDTLGYNLGQIAAIFLGLVCGPLAVFHGMSSINEHKSSTLKLPSFYIFWIALALVLGLGSLIINFDVAKEYLFPPLFVLGATLSTLAVLAWAYRRMGEPLTWRQACLAFVCGSTLAILVALVLETLLPYLGYLLLAPFWVLAQDFADLGWGAAGFVERLFTSPLIVVFLAIVALEAPIPEEFAKALGIPMFGRGRVQNERQAFALGLAAGAGFAILENMLYEGLYASHNGWGWAGITLLRSIGSVLHPLGTGIVALGWFRMRDGGAGKLFKAYLLSVGLHTLWNGGFEPLLYLTGLDYFAGSESAFSLFGETLSALLVGYLLLLSLGLWLLMRRIVRQISTGVTPDLTPATVSRRALATWAVACALVIVPIGATLSPAWSAIRSLFINGEIRQIETLQIGTVEEAQTAYKNKVEDLQALSSLHPVLTVVSQPGDVYPYVITMEKSRPALWSYAWCTTSRRILDENFKNIKLEFMIGGTTIPRDKLAVVDFRASSPRVTGLLFCREYYLVINKWPSGRFQLETHVTFTNPINDGMDQYPAGTRYFRYTVTVKH